MKLNGKRILVTGSSGFVGRNLVEELKRHNVEVVTLTDLKAKRVDIRDWKKIKEIRNIDIVYHLAAITSVPFSFENPGETYEVNVLGTLNILELCRLCNVEKIVFASSYVYGQPEYMPIDEKHPLQPTNPYARSKILGEELCRAYNMDFGLKCIILRPFNIYGVGQNKNFLVPSIIAQLRYGKIELKDSAPKRDFIYISDVIDAYIKAGEFKGDFEVFNIGYGESYSVNEITEKIVQLYGKDIKINYKNERRKNEIMDTVADVRKAKEKLSWEPSVNIDTGLKSMLGVWYKAHGWI
jgi:UDP-glucose 4-epimerase